MKFAARLREERVRIEPHQGRFAKRIGITQNKLSFLETGTRELRADFLAAVAEQGVDVHYVLTGERSIGESVSPDVAELVTAYAELDAEGRELARRLVDTLREQRRRRPFVAAPTLHSQELDYHHG